jgi:hypothetical protein
MSVADETAGAETNDRAERKSVTVYRGRVNRRAGATSGVGENSAVFPIEAIRFTQPTRAGFLVDVTLREHRRHPGSARKEQGYSTNTRGTQCPKVMHLVHRFHETNHMRRIQFC